MDNLFDKLEFNVSSDGTITLDEVKSEIDYYERTELSQSMLKELKKSPAHFKDKYIDKKVKTDTLALTFGKLYHCLLLEENKFDDLFAVNPDINKLTNEYKNWKSQELEKTPNVIFINEKDLLNVKLMIEAINKKETFKILKSLPNAIYEKPIYFTQVVEINGEKIEVKCKAKPDVYIPPNKAFKNGLCFDNKTTTNAKIDVFTRDTLIKYGLHNQSAWYLDALKQEYKLDGYPEFIFLAQEKDSPHESSFLRADTHVIEYGRKENNTLLQQYVECKRSGNWYGYLDDIQDLTLPSWAMQQLINEEI